MKERMIGSLFIVAGIALGGCASIKKADISSSANPSEEIQKLEKEIAEGHRKSLDVIASEDFTKSQEYLKEAKEELADNDDAADVLEEVAYSRAYLERAEKTAESRRPMVDGILNARSSSLETGIRDYGPTRKKLKELDDEMRDNSDDFADLSAEEISNIQSEYLALRFDYTKNQELGKAESMIRDAKDKRAKRYAPVALKRAEIDLANANNMMNAHRSAPNEYAQAVARANLSAEMLSAILSETKEGRVGEKTATQMVMQDRRIQALQSRVGSLQGELGETSQEIGMMNQTLEERNRALQTVSTSVQFQRALENARKEFSPEEAEVYQEGDKLLIRLKAIQFASGRAEIPSQSIELLSKVGNVAKELGPEAIVVQGHTDATGGEEINEKLSKDRAESVARYLSANGLEEEKVEAEGFGFDRPIASNKSAEGRALNRRVDIVITPAPVSAERQPASVEEERGEY